MYLDIITVCLSHQGSYADRSMDKCRLHVHQICMAQSNERGMMLVQQSSSFSACQMKATQARMPWIRAISGGLIWSRGARVSAKLMSLVCMTWPQCFKDKQRWGFFCIRQSGLGISNNAANRSDASAELYLFQDHAIEFLQLRKRYS